MKLFFSLFFCTFSLNLYPCELASHHKFLILSSSVGTLLERLNLQNSENIEAFSSYIPVTTKRKKINGGVFLSLKELNKMEDTIVFFDESKDLKKTLSKLEGAKVFEVKTREKDPYEIVDLNLKLISPYLKGCSQKIKKLYEWISSVKEKYKEKKNIRSIFFLGKIEKNKFPNMIILNDLFISFLVKNNIIKTIKSDFSYLSYSQKILTQNNDYYMFGLLDSKEQGVLFKKIADKKFNIHFKGIFSPGVKQIELLEGARDFLYAL